MNQEFNEIMKRITKFLRPIVLSIKYETRMEKSWEALKGCWKK